MQREIKEADFELDEVRQLGLLREETTLFSTMTDSSSIYTEGPHIALLYKGFSYFKELHSIIGTLSLSEESHRSNPVVTAAIFINGIRLSSSTTSVSRMTNLRVDFDFMLPYGDYLVEIVVTCARDIEYKVNNAKLDIIRRDESYTF